MRIAIREQLAALVLLLVLLALGIVAVPTWVFVNSFTTNVEASGLSLAASLKAALISSKVQLLETLLHTIQARLLLQQAYTDFYNNNATTTDSWVNARNDLQTALSIAAASGLLQARLYSRNTTGDPLSLGLINVTGTAATQQGPIRLPYANPVNGSPVYLGDDSAYSYPPILYPNITYVGLNHSDGAYAGTEAFSANIFNTDVSLGSVLLGPLMLNSSFALLSLTIPVRLIANSNYILGYLTVVASASSLLNIRNSGEGLGTTGEVLIIGSTNPWNHFNTSLAAANATYRPDEADFAKSPIQFLLPPGPSSQRHSLRTYASGNYSRPFELSSYPAALNVLSHKIDTVNNATSVLSTTNEQGMSVAAGVARPQTSLVTWAVVVEQAHGEAYSPMSTLRKILLACVFGTVGAVFLVIYPCAHLGVLPIRRLKAATERSIAPPGYQDELDAFQAENGAGENVSSGGTPSRSSEKGLLAFIQERLRKRRKAKRRAAAEALADANRRAFMIPARVADRKHWITDELSELTSTFNNMTDRLLKQYTSLDEKVAQRTMELSASKKAAEAANESKTLFIANISHELKTPLNGIIGMCAYAMEEDDILTIKQSLKTIAKSSDMLGKLLLDLLDFSRNQMGHQVILEEREFRLQDVKTQIESLFMKPSREGNITLTVKLLSGPEPSETSDPEAKKNMKQQQALGLTGSGKLKDMYLFGDFFRILQVLINLVGNGLKYTPAGGAVDVRIRCLGEMESTSEDSNSSFVSKTTGRAGAARTRVGSGSRRSTSTKGLPAPNQPPPAEGTALSINPLEPAMGARARGPFMTPPPPNAKTYLFAFEVQDNGPGIDPAHHDHIWEPFVQGDLRLSRKFSGAGLGLSICKQLAVLLSGSIHLRSTLGVGSTFTLTIPLKYVRSRPSSTVSAESSARSRPNSISSVDREGLGASAKPVSDSNNPNSPIVNDPQPRLVGLRSPSFSPSSRTTNEEKVAVIKKAMEKKPSGRKLRVLVADDNSVNIQVLAGLLKLEGIYDVTIAKDGQEAYDAVKANMENQRPPFELIFMDVQMPVLDGLQSTRLIRAIGCSSPIVALTAFTEESNVKQCMESGMDEFLGKPIRRPELKRMLKKFATTLEKDGEYAGETAEVAAKVTTPTTPKSTPAPGAEKQLRNGAASAAENAAA